MTENKKNKKLQLLHPNSPIFTKKYLFKISFSKTFSLFSRIPSKPVPNIIGIKCNALEYQGRIS